MKNVINIAEVNCDENGKLCRQEGIEGYPMLYLYNAGHKVDYRGARKLDPMESYVRKAVSTYVSSESILLHSLTVSFLGAVD